MSLEPSSKQEGLSPINEAKSLLSNGDAAGALAVLKKAADEGDGSSGMCNKIKKGRKQKATPKRTRIKRKQKRERN